jgi:hypothetical protein
MRTKKTIFFLYVRYLISLLIRVFLYLSEYNNFILFSFRKAPYSRRVKLFTFGNFSPSVNFIRSTTLKNQCFWRGTGNNNVFQWFSSSNVKAAIGINNVFQWFTNLNVTPTISSGQTMKLVFPCFHQPFQVGRQ